MGKKYSTFKNFQVPSGSKTANEIYNAIYTEQFKSEVEPIRDLVQQGKHDEAGALEMQLKGFTPSGVFSECRSAECLQQYSQVILLEFDDLTGEDLKSTYEQVVATPYIYMAFIGTRGDGLKVFVQVDSTETNHQTAFQQVAAYFEGITDKKVGHAGKDLAHPCFVSYDPDAYLNEQASIFYVAIPKQVTSNTGEQQSEIGNGDLFRRLKKFVASKIPFAGENQSEHIQQLARVCNRFGLTEDETQKFVVNDLEYSGLCSADKYDVVQSVFQSNRGEHGRFAYLAEFAISSFRNATGDLNDLTHTPYIPEEVYQNLSPLLYECCSILSNRREKDVALLGALSVLSGCFPNVTGYYRGKMSAPNLYLLIAAPAANGKGTLEETRLLAQLIHKRMEGEYKAKNKKYKEECRAARERHLPPPERPPVTRLFFPGNSSAAMIMTLLQDNEGQGIIFETEADTLSKTLKLDWGDFSDNLRKAFHHEIISSCRKGDYDCIEIDNPKLSIILSGTPAQVTRLFGSTENGLYSRFFIYAFESHLKWESVMNSVNQVNYNEHYTSLGKQVEQLHDMYKKESVRFILPDSFGEAMDVVFSRRLEDTNLYNEGAESVVKRLALITYRISMLLTIVRVGQECISKGGTLPEVIECCEADFRIAMQLSSALYSHSMLIFRALPNQSGSGFKIRDDKRGFIAALPSKFKREDAIKSREAFGLSPDVVDKLLKKLANTGELIKVEFGYYQKASN